MNLPAEVGKMLNAKDRLTFRDDGGPRGCPTEVGDCWSIAHVTRNDTRPSILSLSHVLNLVGYEKLSASTKQSFSLHFLTMPPQLECDLPEVTNLQPAFKAAATAKKFSWLGMDPHMLEPYRCIKTADASLVSTRI